MKKLLTGLMVAAVVAIPMRAEELTVNFANLGLDNGAGLTDYKVNDNLAISSTGTWNESNQDFRLFSGRSFSVTVTDATLTGVSITCNAGRGFGAFSTVTADSETASFTADPFLWTGEAMESWSVIATPANMNVRMESITFTYTPKAVSETVTAEFLCKDMGISDGEPMTAGGYDANEFININFAQGSHAAQPTYMASAEAFRLFNGQQVVVSAKNGAKLLKISVATTASNTFGYGGNVTADGVAQTYETDYTWVPCEWNGSAEQSVVFENGGKTGNTRVTGITVTYQTPGGELVIARPEIVPADADNMVAINCATEGALIYYSLDGTDPTEETGTLYENPFTITEACTVKAIGFMDGVSSSVASLDVYLRSVDSLKEFLANQSPDAVTIKCPVTAILTQGSYLMVKDNKGSFAIVRNINPDLNEALNVENGTTWANMVATFDPYGDYGFIQPVELGAVSKEEPVTPKVVSLSEFGTAVVPFEYVSIQKVKVEKTGNYLVFTDEESNNLYGYMRFVGITIPDSENENIRYDVTGFASNDSEDLELWPVSFVINTNTGVIDINEDVENTLYFNTQGIRVERPVKGFTYIVVKDGKANKVLIR